jgi:hypothetical protein
MSNSFALYPQSSLPKGFQYPEQIRTFSQTGVYPNIGPWWFIDSSTQAGALMFSIRRHDGRDLVPFAKVDDGRGDLACFDGGDNSGNPRVLMLVLDDSGRAYFYDDFEGWLAAAQQDAGYESAT